jgi:hypothetical protein
VQGSALTRFGDNDFPTAGWARTGLVETDAIRYGRPLQIATPWVHSSAMSEYVLLVYPVLLVAGLLLAARLQPRDTPRFADDNVDDERLAR